MPGLTDQGSGLDRGNPSQGADAGKEGAGTFLDGLLDETGSGSSPASQDGTQAAKSAQATGDKTTVELPGFASALPKESRADEKITAFVSKFKSWDEVVKAAIGLEGKMGGMVGVPKEDASPEEKAEFYSKLGVPKTPEDYKLGEDARVKADPAQVKAFREFAHKHGFTQKQVEALWKESNETTAKLFAQTEEAQRQERANALKSMVSTLKSEWGKDFERNDAIVRRGMEAFGTPELMRTAKAKGYFADPEMVKLFYRVGLAVQEDSTGGRGRYGQGGQGERSGIDRPGL